MTLDPATVDQRTAPYATIHDTGYSSRDITQPYASQIRMHFSRLAIGSIPGAGVYSCAT
jgi:hypothetical protein